MVIKIFHRIPSQNLCPTELMHIIYLLLKKDDSLRSWIYIFFSLMSSFSIPARCYLYIEDKGILMAIFPEDGCIFFC